MSFVLFGEDTAFARECAAVCERWGFSRESDPAAAHFAIAPLLAVKISPTLWAAPALGTLIFHPSALPYRRGPDAIRHTVAAGERVSAATWFWCDAGLDTGPVCEQEPVVLAPGESAGRAYHTRFCPAGLRALERAVAGIASGRPRRIEQDEALATYDRRWPQRDADKTQGPNGADQGHQPNDAPSKAPLGASVQAAIFGGAAPAGAESLVEALR